MGFNHVEVEYIIRNNIHMLKQVYALFLAQMYNQNNDLQWNSFNCFVVGNDENKKPIRRPLRSFFFFFFFLSLNIVRFHCISYLYGVSIEHTTSLVYHKLHLFICFLILLLFANRSVFNYNCRFIHLDNCRTFLLFYFFAYCSCSFEAFELCMQFFCFILLLISSEMPTIAQPIGFICNNCTQYITYMDRMHCFLPKFVVSCHFDANQLLKLIFIPLLFCLF